MLFFRSPISVSKSETVAAGLSGISTAGAKAYSDSGKTESHSYSFGQATATSFGIVENGHAITGATSSVGTSQSSAATGVNRGQQFFPQADAVNVQYPYRPTWNNVGPNDGRNGKWDCRLRIFLSLLLSPILRYKLFVYKKFGRIRSIKAKCWAVRKVISFFAQRCH